MNKIVFFHTDLKGYWKGRLVYLRKYFLTHQIDFQVLEIFGKGSPYDFDKESVDVPWWTCLFPEEDPKFLSDKKINESVASALDSLQPDFLITGAVAFKSGAMGMRWAKRNQKRMAIFDDATHSSIKRNIVVSFIKNKLITQADAFLLPTSFYDNEYKRLGVDSKRLFYGFDCVDNDFFRSNLAYKEKKNWIICVARMVPVKNLKRLLSVWKAIEQRRNGFSLILVGDGFERKNLEQHVRNQQIQHVEFLGSKSSEEIAQLLGQSKALVLPSLSESWGLVINEGMAAGLPVLSSIKVNAAHSLIKNGENGLLFDPYDTEAMKNVLLEFINLDINTQEQWGKASLQTISHLNFNNMAKEIHRCFEETRDFIPVKTNIVVRLALSFWQGRYETKTWDYLT